MAFQKLEPGKTFVFIARHSRPRMEVYRVKYVSEDDRRISLEDAQRRTVGVFSRSEIRKIPKNCRVLRVPKWEMFEDNPKKLPKEIHEKVYRKRMQ